jgi:cob(I)alamin adenosyltransferase
MAITEKNAEVAKSTVSHIEDSNKEIEKDILKSGDEALAFLGGHIQSVSEEENAAVLKKIDWRLMPVLVIVNCIQLIDKNVSFEIMAIAL